MVESTTDSNEFRSKDRTVVSIPDANFNIISGSVTRYTTPCFTRIRKGYRLYKLSSPDKVNYEVIRTPNVHRPFHPSTSSCHFETISRPHNNN
ncbi:hypothetical protein TNCV_716281 [Trichonephila clavipes]|nr:hypothetical protein TNCV_716281 [Trichonephila clavipes]